MQSPVFVGRRDEMAALVALGRPVWDRARSVERIEVCRFDRGEVAAQLGAIFYILRGADAIAQPHGAPALAQV